MKKIKILWGEVLKNFWCEPLSIIWPNEKNNKIFILFNLMSIRQIFIIMFPFFWKLQEVSWLSLILFSPDPPFGDFLVETDQKQTKYLRKLDTLRKEC